ncbi:MAG TPA: class I SAM-dependent methyltransferase [Dehalococcoidia bacterium]
MPDYARIYARQEYLTPGAARTVGIIAERVRPEEGTRLLEMAAGKGEAAAHLAGEFVCQLVAIEPYDPFVHIAAAKFWHFNLRDLVTLVRANGRLLPVRGESMDAAYCIGAPSIVGLEPALRELARVTKPGGWVIVSDIAWRQKPEAPLGPEWGWMAEITSTTAAEYGAAIEAAGLRVEELITHPREDWEEYWRPMQEVAAEAKSASAAGGADVFFADEIESDIEIERRGVREYLDYVTFVARK